jgi:hypothetical protein
LSVVVRGTGLLLVGIEGLCAGVRRIRHDRECKDDGSKGEEEGEEKPLVDDEAPEQQQEEEAASLSHDAKIQRSAFCSTVEAFTLSFIFGDAWIGLKVLRISVSLKMYQSSEEGRTLTMTARDDRRRRGGRSHSRRSVDVVVFFFLLSAGACAPVPVVITSLVSRRVEREPRATRRPQETDESKKNRKEQE